MRIALAQINPLVGDVAGNEQLVRARLLEAREAGAQIVLFPELVLTGYPPEDLLLKEHVLADARAALERLAAEARGIVAVVGFPERAQDVYNAAAVLADGEVRAIYRKCQLPNYGVFDEHRYFQRGHDGGVIDVDGVIVGLTVCEDIWVPGPPASDEALAGARLIVNISASPYTAGKGQARERMIGQRARDELCAIAFCAQVGGQDELVFDGHSFVVDHTGAVIARAAQFEEELLICTVDVAAAGAARLRDTRQRAAAYAAEREVAKLGSFVTERPSYSADAPEGAVAPLLGDVEEVYRALVLGTRDYVRKSGFEHVVLGLSGGIDSALVACVAVDALGPDGVTCVTMPSKYTSDGTFGDAQAIAANLGARLLELPISGVVEAYEAQLADAFAGTQPDLTEENLQARIRGNDLMALSNKFGHLVLTTGNKSEMAVGYSTLYGDSAGGFAVIKDVPKTLVYKLSEWRNTLPDAPIPQTIITRPPSAELRPDQTDQDSLPPYDVLDPILEGYVEQDLGREQLIARGFDGEVVDRIIRLVDLAEYKRRQQPPGIKITSRAFGRDRRMPITNGYRGVTEAPFERRREDGFLVSADRALLDLDVVHAVLRESYWSTGIPGAAMEASIDHSIPFGLYAPDGAQAGFCRVVTDTAVFAYLADVIVLDAYRGRGLGLFLVESALAHPDVQSVRRFHLATLDAHGLYERFGFVTDAQPGILMDRVTAPEDLWPPGA